MSDTFGKVQINFVSSSYGNEAAMTTSTGIDGWSDVGMASNSVVVIMEIPFFRVANSIDCDKDPPLDLLFMQGGEGAHLLRHAAALPPQASASGRMTAGRKCAAKCQPRTVVQRGQSCTTSKHMGSRDTPFSRGNICGYGSWMDIKFL